MDAAVGTHLSLYGSAPDVIAGSTDSPNVPLAFETSGQQWAYALVFPNSTVDAVTEKPVLIRLTIEVSTGSVGVGVLTADRSVFIDEVVVERGPATVVELVLSTSAAGELIVRNASPEGESRGRVLQLDTFELDIDILADREPGLSRPLAMPGWSRFYGSGGDTPVEKLRARAFAGLAEPVVVRWSDGISFRLCPGDQLSRALFVSGTYEPNTLVVLRRLLRPADVFFDVGANAGVFSIVASRWVGSTGRVFAFEPSAREYQRLLDGLTLNDAGALVTPVQTAVGSAVGRALLRVATAQHSGLNTLGDQFSYEGVETAGLEPVDLTTLDEFVRHQRLSRVDVVKLDIEGAEAAALAGAQMTLRDHRPAVIVEVFSRSLAANNVSTGDLERLLRDAGYTSFAIDEGTAALVPVSDLSRVDEQNIVSLPSEREPLLTP